MTEKPLTVLFMPESAYGPTNQCVGLGDILRRRGHRVVFAAEESWKGKLEAMGFEEDLVQLAPPPEADVEQDPGQFWKDFVRDTAPEFRKPTIEQLSTVIKPIFEGLIDGVRYCEEQLREIVARVGADVVAEDNVVCFPALVTADAPFVRIVSCNPLEVKGPGVPPTFSGLPSDDPAEWAAFRADYERTHRELWQDFNAWVLDQGAPTLPELEFIHTSADANVYLYPTEADYTDARPLDATWHRMDSSVRETDRPYELPELASRRPDGSALIYLSLGSLGSADVELMRRLVEVLGRTRHRFIVSKGPLHDAYDLADNMVGAEFLPQTTLMPHVDAVITHGGNNTVTEALHLGKPMVVLPLFWDQYDNAQRIDELGFGVRLPTYTFTDAQLRDALDRVLSHEMRDRLSGVGQQIRSRDGLHAGAEVLETVARRAAATRRG
jgi:MGT family glycosyltransferase